MSRRIIDELGASFDDKQQCVINAQGMVCSTLPHNTFAFKDKIYTLGTIVTYKDYGYTYKAKFIDAETFQTLDGVRTRSFFPSISIQADFVEEIIEPVYYVPKNPIPKPIPEAPLNNGYKTSGNGYGGKTSYYNHLWDCWVDNNGNIFECHAPEAFGFGKYVYKAGTQVIIREKVRFSAKKEIRYRLCTFDGYRFIDESDCKLIDDKISYKNVGLSNKSCEIVAVVNPKYYAPEGQTVTKGRLFKDWFFTENAPIDTFNGTMWYIIIMIVGTLFKGRLLVWFGATLIYLLWRSGRLSGK